MFGPIPTLSPAARHHAAISDSNGTFCFVQAFHGVECSMPPNKETSHLERLHKGDYPSSALESCCCPMLNLSTSAGKYDRTELPSSVA
jgi:hypothetical protein